jgi:hypothetical protein
MQTGSARLGRPSLGAWVTYGLGSENANLPGYVVLTSGGQNPDAGKSVWGSGFLPSVYQGVHCRSHGEPVLYLDNPSNVDGNMRKASIDAINQANKETYKEFNDPETLSRISQYEMAFKMQTAVPDLADMSHESKETLDAYGIKEPADGTYASNCLLARRLLERGVRFVQLYHRGWDHHRNLVKDFTTSANATDKPTAALLSDLKRLGLLDDTLVLWGGEFGRTPMAQGDGRDHHINAFSVWMAGGGIKGGMTYGATDELGYRSVEDVVSVHDLHATMLHLFGVEHEKLSARFQGLDIRLTGVDPSRVVHEIIS